MNGFLFIEFGEETKEISVDIANCEVCFRFVFSELKTRNNIEKWLY